MNILMIADGDTKYCAPHSLVQMIKELKDQFAINISIILPMYSGMKEKLERMGRDVLCDNSCASCCDEG